MKGAIAKWGNSLAVRLPKGLIEDAHMEEGEELEMSVEGEAIVIRRATVKFSLDELMAAYDPTIHHHDEVDWGPSVGTEA
jgi:antitoxin MazE